MCSSIRKFWTLVYCFQTRSRACAIRINLSCRLIEKGGVMWFKNMVKHIEGHKPENPVLPWLICSASKDVISDGGHMELIIM